ncbi:hypothetical protein [Priestia megaterium]|uniref:hypothetical protein n=1 Tax=Priestia megaterium TaxID=1404 RepID=UPI000BFE2225|nr:hypothetical protein [Priestia megaterium]PGO60707.1 hypothetical protein CN981_09220 [Priestia megaterium]
MSTRRTTATKKKQCQGQCGKERAETFFFKVDSPLFPDGRINICRDCVREQVDVDDIESVIGFLRQIDKPFVEKYWNESVQSGKHPLGEYIRKINSLQQMKGKTFNNSDNMNGVGKTSDVVAIKTSDTVVNVKGETIEYSDDLVDKWGIGYKKPEYLKMEKFYQDMRVTHEIHTPVHIQKLMELAYLTIEQERLRQERDIPNYTKLAKTIDDMEKSAGFRPVDRQGLDDATGIKSFSQIFEEVEKRGFRKPPAIELDEDIIDRMIIALANYYHGLVGKPLLAELPEELQKELDDEFYEVSDTPVDLNDEEYKDMDFSVPDNEDEDDG